MSEYSVKSEEVEGGTIVIHNLEPLSIEEAEKLKKFLDENCGLGKVYITKYRNIGEEALKNKITDTERQILIDYKERMRLEKEKRDKKGDE